MVNPELTAYLLSNALVLVLGTALVGVSVAAYRRTSERAFATAAAGFACITLGSVVEAVYELGVRRSFELTSRELLVTHAAEGVLVAVGLATLFYSLWRY
ncbi:MAG: hypothetical protein V5A44_03080 [Haloarculaceae archaeon]